MIGLFMGGVLLMMSPVMTVNHFGGALLAEIITMLIFRSYQRTPPYLLPAGSLLR